MATPNPICIVKVMGFPEGHLFQLTPGRLTPLWDDSIPSFIFPPEYAEIYFESGIWEIKEPYKQDFYEYEACDETSYQTAATAVTDEQAGAITSDGRSSSYYDIQLPHWLIGRILERHEDGQAFIKSEELIEVAFDDDFDAGNAFKSLVRLWGTFNGAGKAGNSLYYEKNKIEYSLGKLEQRYERQSRMEW